MHVTLAAAISINGLITHGDSQNFVSKEDSDWYKQLKSQHSAIIMGRTTYEKARTKMNPTAEVLRVVLTSHPEQFSHDAMPGKLEFLNLPAADVIAELATRQCSKVLVAGGSTVYAQFLAAELIDDMFLTLEPKLFGKGTPLISEHFNEATLDLVDVKPLNMNGTLLLHYRTKRGAIA